MTIENNQDGPLTEWLTPPRVRLDAERQERRELFDEFQQEALRVNYECSDNPVGELPTQYGGNPFDFISSDFRTRPIGWRSMHAYPVDNGIEAAVFYEQRAASFGYYERLRTVREVEHTGTSLLRTADFAVKSVVPGRSINWAIIERASESSEVVSRDMAHPANTKGKRVDIIIKTMAIGGTDLTPDQWQPQTPEDYMQVKGRLIHAISILRKLNAQTLIQDPGDLPKSFRRPIAYPIFYTLRDSY